MIDQAAAPAVCAGEVWTIADASHRRDRHACRGAHVHTRLQSNSRIDQNYLGNGRVQKVIKRTMQISFDFELALLDVHLKAPAAAGGPWSTIRPEPRHRYYSAIKQPTPQPCVAA